MLTARYIHNDMLMPWLLSLTSGRQVLAPVRKGGQTVFAPLAEDSELDLTGLATSSPKEALLPRCETLLEFHYSKGDEVPSKTDLEVREVLPEGQVFLFGARPCDARGFTVFDRVYDAGSRHLLLHPPRQHPGRRPGLHRSGRDLLLPPRRRRSRRHLRGGHPVHAHRRGIRP